MKTWEEYVMEELDKKKAKAETANDNSSKIGDSSSLGKCFLDLFEQIIDSLEEDIDDEEEVDEAKEEDTPEKEEDAWQKAIDNSTGDLILYINVDGVEHDIYLRDDSSFKVALCTKEGDVFPDALLSYDINH